jgi:hypothetical protein
MISKIVINPSYIGSVVNVEVSSSSDEPGTRSYQGRLTEVTDQTITLETIQKPSGQSFLIRDLTAFLPVGFSGDVTHFTVGNGAE